MFLENSPPVEAPLVNLPCPRCGSEYLHQGKVTVYDRGEDAETYLKTEVGAKIVVQHVRASGQDNPSERRDGVAIEFSCENCETKDPGGPRLEFTIAQHKGRTEMRWRTAKPEGLDSDT
jgi:hypothetical protein